MTTVSHEVVREPRRGVEWADVWPSLSISVMWLAVVLSALFGPDIETSNGAGTNTSSVPSAVAIALFAFLGTWVVARYAFRRKT